MRSWARRTKAKVPLYSTLRLSGAFPALHQTLSLSSSFLSLGHKWSFLVSLKELGCHSGVIPPWGYSHL